ncbi:uncharacterized protein EI90DRAFT_3115535 [Cantharellus anzutake]|uniref:uncharacterized protein n=1 Tax=Cantharellus anzutake TaxID=1750568 RepID=UPI001904E3CE|nr:uncharacterized protein EI90DRAFT_3115535 [Cantharellus anzutake]KAF8343033.1 hypothetical protein EI90DRAFT_3115535 [Cantharellus anzutake]
MSQEYFEDPTSSQVTHPTGDHDGPRLVITALPVEILVNILKYLPLSGLLRCKQASFYKDLARSSLKPSRKHLMILYKWCLQTTKALFYVIEGSLVLQYKIEREACLLAGAVAAYLNRLPAAEKLSDLRRREVGWASLKWQPQTYTIPIDPSDSIRGLYELQHGFFARGWCKASTSGEPDGLWLQPLPGVVGRPSSTKSRRLSLVPNSIGSGSQVSLEGGDDDGVEIDSIQTPIFNYLGFEFQEFNIDPEQNLAVYVCRGPDIDGDLGSMIVKIRQMSDNALHPLARYETLDTRSMSPEQCMYYVEIFGDFIGVMVRGLLVTNCRFWIWNWKTGICQCELSGFRMDSFLFLSPRHFVIPRREGSFASLLVYAFRPCYYDGPPTKPCLPSQHIATFQLPQLSSGSAFSRPIWLRCEPTPVFEAPEYEKLSPEEPPPADGPTPNTSLPLGSAGGPSTTTNNPPKPAPANALNGLFVRPRQDDFRVAVFSFGLGSAIEPDAYKMFVAMSDIYRMAKRFESEFHASRETLHHHPDANPDNVHALPVHVPWDNWGRRSARLLEISGGETWVCYIFMNRYIFRTLEFELVPGEVEENVIHLDQICTSRLHVLDFNPYSVLAGSVPKRNDMPPTWETLFGDTVFAEDARASNSDDGVEHSVDMERQSGVEEPPSSHSNEPSRMSKDYRIWGRMETHLESTESLDLGFACPVISRLPYRQVTSNETFPGDVSPMIDAERILLVDVSLYFKNLGHSMFDYILVFQNTRDTVEVLVI